MKYNKKIQNTVAPFLMLLFVSKVVSFKKGALVLLSIPFGLSITKLISNLFENVTTRDIALPIFSSAIVFMLFLLFFIMDFFTGISASRKEAGGKDFIESGRLWRSFWKLYGYITLLFFMVGFSIAFAVIGSTFFYDFFVYSIMTIGFMFSMFEFHSIGENWERIYGSKHKIFLFFDKITKAVETKIIDKINNLF